MDENADKSAKEGPVSGESGSAVMAGATTPAGYIPQEVVAAYNDYISEWNVIHNQLLRIQDQYMPRSRTY
jgi:hypothetical protein